MSIAQSRLREARGAIEAGEPVNWRRLAELQLLDMAILGEDMAAEAIQREKEANARIERIIEQG